MNGHHPWALIERQFSEHDLPRVKVLSTHKTPGVATEIARSYGRHGSDFLVVRTSHIQDVLACVRLCEWLGLGGRHWLALERPA